MVRDRTLAVVAVAFLLAGAVTGYWTAPTASGGPQTESAPEISGATDVFVHNLRAVVLLIASAISFGVLTATTLFVIGFNIGAGVAALGLPISTILLLIVPHGVFEMSALIVAAVAGFRPPIATSNYLRKRRDRPFSRTEAKRLGYRIVVAIVLLAGGAIIEARFTAPLARGL